LGPHPDTHCETRELLPHQRGQKETLSTPISLKENGGKSPNPWKKSSKEGREAPKFKV